MDQNELRTQAEGIIARAQSILTKPAETWPVIAKETDEPMKVLIGYVAPLAAIGPIASFIGNQLFPISVFGVTVKTPLIAGITGMVLGYVLALVGVFVVSFIANLMSKQFGGRDDFAAAFRLTAYSMTAAWIGGMFGIFPALGILGLLAALYGLYLFYKGSTPVMDVPEDKAVVYTVVVIVCAIVFNLIVGGIIASVTALSMFGAAATSIGGASSDNGVVNIESPYGNMTITEDGDTSTMTIENNGETMTIEVPNEEE